MLKFILVTLCIAYAWAYSVSDYPDAEYGSAGCDVEPEYIFGFSSACTETRFPYCMPLNPGADDYHCAECRSNCDCGINEFCSLSTTTHYGSCIPFAPKQGTPCKPLGSQITDLTFDEEDKCAAVFPDSNSQGVDYYGSCIGGTCYFCSPGATTCSGGGMVKEPTRCAYPGTEVYSHSYNWAGGPFYENPQAVWLAIFFPFLFIILALQCISFGIAMSQRK